MKPFVICHMVASVDGRILISRWRPKGVGAGLFERLHEQLGGDAWLVGRVTGQEFAKGETYPNHIDRTYPRKPWFARPDADAYGVVLDAHGKIAWGRSDIGGDSIVAVLTEQVSDAHLAGLRKRWRLLHLRWRAGARSGARAGDPQSGARGQTLAGRGRRRDRRLPSNRPSTRVAS
ncbi:MAG: hypothetical protein WA709_10125 [Stellaceae bacterium]